MKKILLLLVLLGSLSISSVHAMGNSTISKADVCKNNFPDGIYYQSLAINNYPGFRTIVGSFYKDKKKLYYVVDAENVNNGTREAFLWSWDCARKTPKQLSQYNFSKVAGEGNSWLESYGYEAIRIIYVDKDHIIVRQPRTYKGPTPPDKFLVFYRSNQQVSTNFALENLGGFSIFRERIQNKQTIQVPCDPRMDKGCYGEFGKDYTFNLPENKEGFQFYLNDIRKDSDGTIYLEVDYKSSTAGCPPWIGETPDQCIQHRFNIPVNLGRGTINYTIAETFRPR